MQVDAIDSEIAPADESQGEALFWTGIYGEILEMQDRVLPRAWELMAAQSHGDRRKIRLASLFAIEAQSARFRDRLDYWKERLRSPT